MNKKMGLGLISCFLYRTFVNVLCVISIQFYLYIYIYILAAHEWARFLF